MLAAPRSYRDAPPSHRRRLPCARRPIAARRDCTGSSRPTISIWRISATFFQRLTVPGVSRDGAGIECFAQAHGIAGERNVPLRSSRAKAPSEPGVGRGAEHGAAVGKEVALACQRIDRHRLVPVGGEIAGRLPARCAAAAVPRRGWRRLPCGTCCSRVVRMQMRIDHDVDIVGPSPFQQGRSITCSPGRIIGAISLAKPTPTAFGISGTVAWQPASTGAHPGHAGTARSKPDFRWFHAPGRWEENALAHAQPAARQCIFMVVLEPAHRRSKETRRSPALTPCNSRR